MILGAPFKDARSSIDTTYGAWSRWDTVAAQHRPRLHGVDRGEHTLDEHRIIPQLG
ncbi:hypothetical protein [Brevibacterium sp. FME17]|uniref:hypothetical protein n=1 Tax=Brevibacterium sp. FME17 TaxID=2742606 RepID=UPI001866D5B3|nr:hypothetical protein [Brevibacterium sp. FME17]